MWKKKDHDESVRFIKHKGRTIGLLCADGVIKLNGNYNQDCDEFLIGEGFEDLSPRVPTGKRRSKRSSTDKDSEPATDGEDQSEDQVSE